MENIKKLYNIFLSKVRKIYSIKYLTNKIMKKRGIVILMYHSIPKDKNSYGYSTYKGEFERQITFLKQYYNVISIDDTYEYLYNNKKMNGDKPFAVITFDDGYKDNKEVAYPILKECSFPFTIFITTDFIENDNYTFMSFDEVKEMNRDSLVTFGSHSKSHANLIVLVENDKVNEIVVSREKIEKNLIDKVNYFAYPSGGYDKICLDEVEKNYKLGFKDRTTGLDDLDKRKIARVSIDARHNNFKVFLIELAYSRYLKG